MITSGHRHDKYCLSAKLFSSDAAARQIVAALSVGVGAFANTTASGRYPEGITTCNDSTFACVCGAAKYDAQPNLFH
jgi:hypothetical protein